MDLSKKYYDRARIIPGRANTRSKKPGHMFDVGRGPMYAWYGDGAELFDVDGNRYIDMLCALGAVSLGYNGQHPLSRSGVCSLPYRGEVAASEAILRHVAPWATHVRLLRTGSEATHAAYRIAKAATGRDIVLVGDWAYHGWHEWCATPKGAGVVMFPHGFDFASKLLHAERTAAIFIEPHRWEPVTVAWLRSVREFCSDNGILLVFDEMIYGGRWALGGATEYFGTAPDLACFGKAIGNGAPAACVVGRDVLAKHGEIVSGTYAGDADAASAVCRTLQTYARSPVIETLWNTGRYLAVGLEKAIDVSGWRGCAFREGQPVHQRLRFADAPLGREFAARMAARGILWSPDCVNIMYAHTTEQMDQVVSAAASVLEEMNPS